jgi:hypothetical protein
VDATLSEGVALAETIREHGVAVRRTRPDAQTRIRKALSPLLCDKAFDGVDRVGEGYR